jgi:2-keto-4-pentenoate hydratase
MPSGEGLPPNPAGGYTEAEVWAAVTRIDLCFELCGTRLALGATAGVASPYLLLADAMCNALVVCGSAVGALAAYQPAMLTTARVSIEADGETISRGDGRENPEDSPLGALVWFVNDLTHRRRRPLPSGALVISGHTCQAAFSGRVAPESAALLPQVSRRSQRSAMGGPTRLTARFEGLGVVEVSILP